MVCPLCKAEVATLQGFCPHCGSLTGPSFVPQPALSSKLWWVPLAVVAVLLVAVVGAAIYLWHSGSVRRLAESIARSSRPVSKYKPVTVKHGGLVKPEQLLGGGKVYFVPIGPQVIPPTELAAHYKQKFDLGITVLPEIPIDSSMPHKSERRYLGDGLIRSIMDAYPRLTDKPHTVLIGLTNVDLYIGDDEFVTSYRGGSVAVVSSRGFDYEGDGAEDPATLRRDLQERRMLQMLTKYIALAHWRLHENNDPESVLDQPLLPNGGRDDLYQSDLDPELTPAGRWESSCAMIYFIYSYRAKRLTTVSDSISEDCEPIRSPRTFDSQVIMVDLLTGRVGIRDSEFRIPSTPPIELERTYISDFAYERSFGFGSAHNYDLYLTTDNPGLLDKVGIAATDFDSYSSEFRRISAGKGFSPDIVLEGKEPLDREFFRSKVTWHPPDFYVETAGGKFYSFLGCGSHSMCYWDGYRDASGHELQFTRDGKQDLIELKPAQGPALEFKYNSQKHITEIRSSNGQSFHYEYDDAGNLAVVTRPGGRLTQYAYDSHHNLTSIAIANRAGAGPKKVFSAEYNVRSELSRLEVAGQREYVISRRTMGRAKEINIIHGGFNTLILTGDCDCKEFRIFRRPIAVAAVQPVH